MRRVVANALREKLHSIKPLGGIVGDPGKWLQSVALSINVFRVRSIRREPMAWRIVTKSIGVEETTLRPHALFHVSGEGVGVKENSAPKLSHRQRVSDPAHRRVIGGRSASTACGGGCRHEQVLPAIHLVHRELADEVATESR